MRFLRDEGCQEMQGFLIGRPISAEDVWEQIQESDAGDAEAADDDDEAPARAIG